MKTVKVEWYQDGEKIGSASLAEHKCGDGCDIITVDCEGCGITSRTKPILIGVCEDDLHYIQCRDCLERTGGVIV